MKNEGYNTIEKKREEIRKMKKAIDFKAGLTYLAVSALAVLLAFNYQLFIVNNGFAPAGLNGIATMIQYKTGFSIGYVSIIINLPLCIMAYFLLDRAFAKHSLTFSLVYSLSFLAIQKIGFSEFQYNAGGHDTIYPVLISGLISGLIYGLSFRNNSSTGGTDVVSKYISAKKPHMNFFWVTFTLNAVVAIISFFVYAEEVGGETVYNYKPICLCVIYCFISSFVGNYIIQGTKNAYKFTIITSHPDPIITEIKEKLRHSATKVSAVGAYTGGGVTMILCVINKHQIVDLNKILSEYKDTFAFSETVNDTYGNFKKIK